MHRPLFSVIVNFHNMRREAPRTLFSLSANYQLDISESEYEVLAIDHGSSEPLNPEIVRSFGANFAYRFEATDCPSPCAAINRAVRESCSDYVVLMIDGARILSPGILGLMKRCIRMYERCFVYTLAMHLGPQIQNVSLTKGYSQLVEDGLLADTDWQTDGYRLFSISTIAPSSGGGYFSLLHETNCAGLSRNDFLRLGGLCEAFKSPGGGLANLDFFNQVMSVPEVCPIMLLGEATFHQFHGGVATNVAMDAHPFAAFAAEYKRIRGTAVRPPTRMPQYFGSYRAVCKKLFDCADREEVCEPDAG
jgi:glycosyltransferase involved in cell wall biosynthesis